MMAALSFIRILTTCAAAGAAAILVVPASACESGRCEVSAPAAGTKPLKLKTFMRKPVATSATRTVKKKDGAYTKVTIKRRAKARVAAPEVTPETISPAAAQAFASYELARVRVVTPEEIGKPLFSDTATTSSDEAAVIGVDNVQVVSAGEVNDIDRKADSSSAVSLDTLSRNLATSAEPKAESDSWFQRMMMVFGGAFAAVAALVRTLLG
jgi:hypothetical protein